MSDDKSKVDMSGAWNRTRDGRKAGVYWVGTYGNYPVHGWVEYSDGHRETMTWESNGRYHSHLPNHPTDLIRERKAFRCERWVAVFDINGHPSPYSVLSHTYEQAVSSQPNAGTYVKVIIEGHEGDGLEVEK